MDDGKTIGSYFANYKEFIFINKINFFLSKEKNNNKLKIKII